MCNQTHICACTHTHILITINFTNNMVTTTLLQISILKRHDYNNIYQVCHTWCLIWSLTSHVPGFEINSTVTRYMLKTNAPFSASYLMENLDAARVPVEEQ